MRKWIDDDGEEAVARTTKRWHANLARAKRIAENRAWSVERAGPSLEVHLVRLRERRKREAAQLKSCDDALRARELQEHIARIDRDVERLRQLLVPRSIPDAPFRVVRIDP